jgi:hypothetical protein
MTLMIAGCGSSGTKATTARTPATTAAATAASLASHLSLPPGREIVLTYRALGSSKAITTASINATIAVIQERMAAIGVPADIRRRDTDEIAVALPTYGPIPRGQQVVGKTAQLLFYDWEPNVVGSNGKPAPTEGTVTGDSTPAGAGGVTAGLTEYRAVMIAARRAPILRANDTTWSAGCTPKQEGDCMYGTWFLIDPAREKVLWGPAETEGGLHPAGYKPAAGAKAVRINPGTVIVQAQPFESANGKIINSSPNSY